MAFPISDTTLRLASPEQAKAANTASFIQWGKGLTLEQYLAKEQVYEKMDRARDGRLRAWVLVPRNDMDTTDILSSCSTYAQDAIQASAESSEVERVTGYGIASVFTPPDHRRNGYGQHMMRLLHHILAPKESLPAFPAEWGAPPTNIPSGLGNARASVLYSDIGDTFYRDAGPDLSSPGWVVTDRCERTVWDTTPAGGESAILQILQEDDAAAIMDKDAEALLAGISTVAAEGKPRIQFAFLPTPGLNQFQTVRYLLNSPTAQGTDTWGATTATTATLNFATWTFDKRDTPPLLIFTRLRCDVENLAPLLDTAKIVARKLGLERIEAWNLPPRLSARAEAPGGKTEKRTDHLSSIAWYGGGEVQNVEWVLNEKYCWC